VVKFAKGRVPVIAGTGSNSTTEAVALTRAAKEAGAAAALLISPYYNKPTQEGIYAHYKTVAERAQLPLIVYNIPGRTASKIEATTVARLAELEHIIGLKEATGSLDEVQEVIRLCGDKIDVYCGDDSLTLPVLAVGGVGVISVISNIIPQESANMVAACGQGDWAKGSALHYRMLPLMRALFQETNPIGIKAAVAMMGYCRDELRLPLLPMTDGARAKLRSAMHAFGLVER
jgi:4-hydroxy-tetrahydrodipicolinate synthase